MDFATPADWKIKPLPSKRKRIALDRSFSAAEMAGASAFACSDVRARE